MLDAVLQDACLASQYRMKVFFYVSNLQKSGDSVAQGMHKCGQLMLTRGLDAIEACVAVRIFNIDIVNKQQPYGH